MDGWMPRSFEGCFDEPNCFNLPTQVVSRRNDTHLERFFSFPIKCEYCGVEGHKSEWCPMIGATRKELDEYFWNHYNPHSLDYCPKWGSHFAIPMYHNDYSLSPSPFSVVCEFCGGDPYAGMCTDRILKMSRRWRAYKESFFSQPHNFQPHRNNSSPSFWGSYQENYNQPEYSLEAKPSFEEEMYRFMDDIRHDTRRIREPLDESAQLIYNPYPQNVVEEKPSLEDALWKFMDEMKEKSERQERILQEHSQMSHQIAQVIHNPPQPTPFLFSWDGFESEKPGRENLDLEMSCLENEPFKGNSSSLFPTFESHHLKEGEVTNFNDIKVEEVPELMHNSLSDDLDDEDLSICKTIASQVEDVFLLEFIEKCWEDDVPLERGELIGSNVEELEEKPRIVLSVFDDLDEADLLICKEITNLVECCFIDASIFDVTDDMEPLESHGSSLDANKEGNDVPMLSWGDSEKNGLDFFASQHEKDPVGEVEHEGSFVDEWYKVEFVIEKVTWMPEGKSFPTPSLFCYMRSLSMVEISFFWYRDGYSDIGLRRRQV